MEIAQVCVELSLGKISSNPVRSEVGVELSKALEPQGVDIEVGDLRLQISATELGSGIKYSVGVTNTGVGHAVIRRVGFRFPVRARAVMETGYQSWSPIRICAPDDIRPRRRYGPMLARGSYHADPHMAGKVVAGDQYLLWMSDDDCGVVGFLDAKEHLSTIEAHKDALWAWALMDRVIIEPGKSRHLDPLWIANGETGPLYSQYAGHWGDSAGARNATPSAVSMDKPGWCSWYEYFWKVGPKDVRESLPAAAKHDFALMVIDDGYQSQIGDWLVPNSRWSEPGSTPPDLAAEIAAGGMNAGLWTAPFFVGKKSAVATTHPEWLARSEYGAYPLHTMYNPIGWGGWTYAIDTTQPAVLEHLRQTYSGLRSQGFSFHKIDFCFGATMPGRRSQDGNLTRAQGIRAGLQAVREGIGEDAYLLGCGCPFGPAVGIVDAMRVSPDVAPYWNPGLLQFPAYGDAAPAAVNSVRASVLRAPLHRRLFSSDPDCAVLRPTNTKLGDNHRKILAEMIAGTGGFALLSDNLTRYGEAEWRMFNDVRAVAATTDQPLDLIDPFAKVVTVVSESTRLRVDWGDKAARPTQRSPGGETSDNRPPTNPVSAPWSSYEKL